MKEPVIGQRYSWPKVGEEITVQEIERREVVIDGVSFVSHSVRISNVAWLPWCGGVDFVEI